MLSSLIILFLITVELISNSSPSIKLNSNGNSLTNFSLVISSAGFLLAISVFFLYGVEEVAHPIGAIVFHSGGIAGSLGIGLFSLFPLLIIHQLNSQNTTQKPGLVNNIEELPPEPKLESDDWEMATEDELKSGEFEAS